MPVAAGLEAQLPGRTRADVGGVDVEVVEHRAERALRRVVEGAQEEALPVVDLRPVLALVAGHVDETVPDLEVERDGLAEERAGAHEKRQGGRGGGDEPGSFSHVDLYFKSPGERLEPWTATWQLVQLR